MNNSLQNYLIQHIKLSKRETDFVKNKLNHLELKKGDSLLNIGDVCSSAYFIISGSFYQYPLDDDLSHVDVHLTSYPSLERQILVPNEFELLQQPHHPRKRPHQTQLILIDPSRSHLDLFLSPSTVLLLLQMFLLQRTLMALLPDELLVRTLPLLLVLLLLTDRSQHLRRVHQFIGHLAVNLFGLVNLTIKLHPLLVNFHYLQLHQIPFFYFFQIQTYLISICVRVSQT